MSNDPDFDVALSFAGEDRPYVDSVAHALRGRGIKVFYDLFEEADLWGKDLYAHLSNVYQKRAKFTVMFISDAYSRKLWTNHERRAAQARAFQEAQEYILPAKFDNTEIPGVLPTVGYVSLTSRTPAELASLIARKLVSAGGSVPTELVRKDFSIASSNPSADPTRCVIILTNDEAVPVAGATITAQADNGTTVEGSSDVEGRCELIMRTRRRYRLLIAHPNYPAAIVECIDPAEGARVMIPRIENIGSILIHSTGHIPGLAGSVNPILDTSNRAYMYADNIAIDGGKNQPATFEINVPVELEDANGTVVFTTVKHIAGRVALLQYTRRI
jgi:hypothetical protein